MVLENTQAEEKAVVFDRDTIDTYFPMPSYREGQKKVIEFTIDAFNSGKDIVLLQCPTGSGKSAIGMTVAKMVESTYYLTITKILQDQLIGDFGKSVIELKGRNAYPCTLYDRMGDKLVNDNILPSFALTEVKQEKPSCNEGFCRVHNPMKGKTKCGWCFTASGDKEGKLSVLPPNMQYSACPYYEQVHQAVNGRIVTMNFSSFLYQTQMTKRFKKRDLLVVDEAHNIESQLMDFISLSISDINLQKQGIFIPKLETSHEYALWFEDIHLEDLIKKVILKANTDNDIKLQDEFSKLLKRYQFFMENIINSDSEWVPEHREIRHHNKTHRTVELRPVFVREFADKLLFNLGRKILMMSATILDPVIFCSNLGIERSRVAAYSMKNRFPADKRPIYISGVGKLTGGKAKMNEWGPKVVNKVNELVRKYDGQRGIIHTHNFAIMDMLLKQCDQDVRTRFIQQRDFADKQTMLKVHARRGDSIIVAPAMHEGLDLKDDLSRLQIICKVPFANYYENPQLARRVELDQRYYLWMTALKLVQSYGRSIRSEDDWADTYIIDSCIEKFLVDAKSILPEWFHEAIKKR